MKKVKITVLKTTLDEELAAEYGAEGLGPCPCCGKARCSTPTTPSRMASVTRPGRLSISMCSALAHGAGEGLFYYGDWIRRPGVAICSCNDGLRPVIFKLETTEEEASVNYTPVR